MENDPNKKDSKGKKLFKKAARRSSKSNSSNQSSALEIGAGVSRSKSEERSQAGGGGGARAARDAAPLPTPEASAPVPPAPRKSVDIQEGNNQVYEEVATGSKRDKSSSLDLDKNNASHVEPETSKRGLKRKLEEESGAGTSGTSTGASDTDADDRDPSKDKKKKNRCAVCRKKVGLTGFECRCGGLFCAVHRYSDKHDCSFDYRELGAQEIRRNNPVVVSQKIHKI